MTGGLAALTGPVALGISAAALVAGGLALVVSRRPAVALAVLLDLLLAAGLLRLVGAPGWQGIATAAAIVLLRRLIGFGLRLGGRSWASESGRGETSPPGSRTLRRLLGPVRRP